MARFCKEDHPDKVQSTSYNGKSSLGYAEGEPEPEKITPSDLDQLGVTFFYYLLSSGTAHVPNDQLHIAAKLSRAGILTVLKSTNFGSTVALSKETLAKGLDILQESLELSLLKLNQEHKES